MTRPTQQQMFMAIASIVAQRSTCVRSQVGCIITDLDGTTIVGMGYNGNARGLPNICDTEMPGKCGCIHAEVNALLKTPYHGVDHLVMYTTLSPCLDCAKLILNSKVHTVYYAEMYRNLDGVALLRQRGVDVMTVTG